MKRSIAVLAALAALISTALVAAPAKAAANLPDGGVSYTPSTPSTTVAAGSTIQVTYTQICTSNAGIVGPRMIDQVSNGQGYYVNWFLDIDPSSTDLVVTAKKSYTLNVPGTYTFDSYGFMCGTSGPPGEYWTSSTLVVTVLPGPMVRPVPVWGFVAGTTNLKDAYKAQLRAFLNRNTRVPLVSCYPALFAYTSDADRALGHDRAVAACDYMKSVRPSLTTAYGNILHKPAG